MMRTLIIAGASFACGTVAMAYLAMQASPTYLEISTLLRTQFEEHTAVCARRAGDLAGAAEHYRAVLDLEENAPEHAAIWTMTFPITSIFTTLVRSSVLSGMTAEQAARVKSAREALVRAKLARVLEDDGRTHDADLQYERAATLVGRSDADVRKYGRDQHAADVVQNCPS